VTPASFDAWKSKFLQEMKTMKEGEQDEKLKGLSSKDREEAKRVTARLTGPFIFRFKSQIHNTLTLRETTLREVPTIG
jgi:hypothetical protein